MKSLRRLL